MQRKLTESAQALVNLTAQLEASQLETAVKHGALEEALSEHKDRCSVLVHELEGQRQIEEELRTELAEVTGAHKRGPTKDPEAALNQVLKEVGVRDIFVTVPPRTGDSNDWAKSSTRHMATVLAGRGEGEDIELVAKALHRCGYLQRLEETELFQPVARRIAAGTIEELARHWTARHAVHIWDRLELSRSQMETLRHLLSFSYDAEADKYIPIPIWVNPFNETDYVSALKLTGRVLREREYLSIVDSLGIAVGENGRCERDVIKCTSLLYSNYAMALREEYSNERPAQPVLFLDGTGGALNRGITHAEMGCADFIAVGDSDAKQSRATLQPVALYAGSDHAQDQRDNLPLVFSGYNRLMSKGSLTRTVHGLEEEIPCSPMTAADMQGAKATYGMAESSHAVWCKCRRPQHLVFPDHPMETYEEMMAYIDEVGCVIKTHEELCSWAHYSPGVAKGARFTAFKCGCCGYAPKERQWRADLAAWHLLTDEEQEQRRRAHLDRGDEAQPQKQHYHQNLFQPPLPHHGMERAGVDNLHINSLNLFKHLFKYTIHDGLPDSKKKLVRAYCRAAGFYSYDAASDTEDPTKHWIGREVKRFIAEAHKHVPVLLQLAAAPIDSVPELEALRNAKGEEMMEEDDEYAPTEEEIEQEENEEPLMMQNALAWDNFIALIAETSRPWPQGAADTDDYRKGRALAYFNKMSVVGNDILRLKPEMLTWVPHIALFIVSRQMVTLGDPTRRSCDACESFGAMMKKTIKHTTCRRHITPESTEHKGKGKTKAWKQHFSKGFIEQAFARASVRESLQHGPENAPFLQRVDARRTRLGKASASRKAYASASVSMETIYELAKQRMVVEDD